MSSAWRDQLTEARQRLRNRFEAAEPAVLDPATGHVDDPHEQQPESSDSAARRLSTSSSYVSDDEVSNLLLPAPLTDAASPASEVPGPTTSSETRGTATPAAGAAPVDEPTCRICFCGVEEEAELGRLFSPCKCSGTSQWVHRQCLENWRRAATGSKSYFQCDQCHYAYKLGNRFFAAKVIQSQAALLVLTCVLFSMLIWAAGFVANWIIASAEDRAARFGDSAWNDMFVSDFQIVGESVKEAARLFEKKVTDKLDTSAKLRPLANAPFHPGRRMASHPPVSFDELPAKDTNVAQRTAVHFAKGLSLVGMTSFFHSFIATAFVGPFGLRGSLFRALRPGRRRNGNEPATAMQVVLFTFVLFGVIKAVTQVYHGVKWLSRRVLQRLETFVLEV